MTNAETLRQLMRDYDLTRKKTAALLELPENTLDSWLKPATNKSHRPMPNREVSFLRCLLRPMQKKITKKPALTCGPILVRVIQ